MWYEIETVAINLNGERVLINKSDFNANEHIVFSDETVLDVANKEQEIVEAKKPVLKLKKKSAQ
jgi:hypothetical protein